MITSKVVIVEQWIVEAVKEPTCGGWSSGELMIMCGDGGQLADGLMPVGGNRRATMDRQLPGRRLTVDNPYLMKTNLAMVL